MMKIKQLQADEVMPFIMNDTTVYMLGKNINRETKLWCLGDFTVDTLMKNIKKNDVIFFIIDKDKDND